MFFQFEDEDSASVVSSSNFFAWSLGDRSTAKKRLFTILKVLLIATSIVVVPMLKDALTQYLQHASAQALHIDESLAGVLFALFTKLPELSKLFARPCSQDGLALNYINCDEDQ